MTEDNPPVLPFRCATVLAKMTPEAKERYWQATLRMEREYVDWVRSHPDPSPEWLRRAKRIEEMWAHAMELKDPNNILGKILRSMSSCPPGQQTATVIVLGQPPKKI